MEFRHQTAYKQAIEAIAQCNLPVPLLLCGAIPRQHSLTVRNAIQEMKTP